MATTTLRMPAGATPARRGLSLEATWGVIFVIPYILFFLIFVVWPVAYGVWLGTDPASYAKLFSDPIFGRTAINTIVKRMSS